MKKLLALILSVMMMFSLVACSDNASSDQTGTDDSSQVVEDAGLWGTAIYTEDAQVGEGANTVAIVVAAEEKSITITLKTDETNLGQALRKSGFVEGSESDYGLYISHVNGIKAVYEEDNAWWAFLDGEGNMMATGVDEVELTGNDTYQLTYTPA